MISSKQRRRNNNRNQRRRRKERREWLKQPLEKVEPKEGADGGHPREEITPKQLPLLVEEKAPVKETSFWWWLGY